MAHHTGQMQALSGVQQSDGKNDDKNKVNTAPFFTAKPAIQLMNYHSLSLVHCPYMRATVGHWCNSIVKNFEVKKVASIYENLAKPPVEKYLSGREFTVGTRRGIFLKKLAIR
jgi:hypothetical protein